MQKKTMFIGGAAIAAVVLLLGGAGIALAVTDGFDDNDDTRTSQVSDQTQGGSSQATNDDSYNNDNTYPDPDDAPISDADRSSAEDAAVEAAGGGTVTDLDRSDDNDHAWEVEVTFADGHEVDVELDADFGAVRVDPES